MPTIQAGLHSFLGRCYSSGSQGVKKVQNLVNVVKECPHRGKDRYLQCEISDLLYEFGTRESLHEFTYQKYSRNMSDLVSSYLRLRLYITFLQFFCIDITVDFIQNIFQDVHFCIELFTYYLLDKFSNSCHMVEIIVNLS